MENLYFNINKNKQHGNNGGISSSLKPTSDGGQRQQQSQYKAKSVLFITQTISVNVSMLVLRQKSPNVIVLVCRNTHLFVKNCCQHIFVAANVNRVYILVLNATYFEKLMLQTKRLS